MPYFIWPNIQPFLSIQPFSVEYTSPLNFWALLKNFQSVKLQKARQDVKTARANQLGVHGKNHATGALILQGFELRFLGRQSVPDRYVIDLNDEGNNKLIAPERYYEIPNAEDRLFIPAECSCFQNVWLELMLSIIKLLSAIMSLKLLTLRLIVILINAIPFACLHLNEQEQKS